MKKMRPSIQWDGQKYVDQPVFKVVSDPTKLAQIVSVIGNPIFLIPMRKQLPQTVLDKPVRIADVEYHRVRLQWMKPDGKGGLVPRD